MNIGDPARTASTRPENSRAGLLFRAWRALYQDTATAFGTTLSLLFILIAIAGPLLAPYGLNEQIAEDVSQPPSFSHLFGTDHLGRDVLSRVIIGARSLLLLTGSGTLLAVALGVLIGLTSGYLGGFLDQVVMRLFDSLLSLPALLLALLLLGTFGSSGNSVVIVIVVLYVPIVARVVRSVVLSTKTRSYVEAARVQGEPLAQILLREIFPATLPALAVEASLRFSYAIFLVASLGFLGVGVHPPNPNWGLMVKEARKYAVQTPWALFFPAAAIAVVVVGVNLMAEGLKDILQTPSRMRR